MLATLSKMGVGLSFLHWVRLFYTGGKRFVYVNGYLGPFFVLSRGVRQGCPLSSLLYVLVSEVLAVKGPRTYLARVSKEVKFHFRSTEFPQ